MRSLSLIQLQFNGALQWRKVCAKKPVLSKSNPVAAICGFLSGSCFAMLGYVVSAHFLDYWRASTDGGMRIFTSCIWCGTTFLMVLFGLKLANRCADILLDRLESK